MTAIHVVNKSTSVSDADVALMTRAAATQVSRDAAPAWRKWPAPVTFVPGVEYAQPGAWVIAVLDDPDQADALGWHTEEQGDLIYGRVFAKPVLDNGGNALTDLLSVASVLSHEVLETLVDPSCNLQADTNRGYSIALEVADPVESDSYVIPVRPRAGGSVAVTVSNFVLPSWFDPNASTADRFDWLHKVAQPFSMSAGGYLIKISEGRSSAVYGESYPEWRKAMKATDTSRTARRIGTTAA